MKQVETIENQVDGLVLEARDENHTNRRLTILTQKHGVITAYANGAKKATSPLAGVARMFAYARFILVRRGNLYTVRSGEMIHSFIGLFDGVETLSLAAYLCQLTKQAAPKDEQAKESLRLLLNTLYKLENKNQPLPQIKSIYELRLMSLVGYLPNLVACQSCGKYEDDRMFFLPNEGFIRCGDCFDQGDSSYFFKLSPPVLRAMRHIVYSEPERLFRFHLTGLAEASLERVCEAFLLSQMDRSFHALHFYKEMIAMPELAPEAQEEKR